MEEKIVILIQKCIKNDTPYILVNSKLFELYLHRISTDVPASLNTANLDIYLPKCFYDSSLYHTIVNDEIVRAYYDKALKKIVANWSRYNDFLSQANNIYLSYQDKYEDPDQMLINFLNSFNLEKLEQKDNFNSLERAYISLIKKA